MIVSNISLQSFSVRTKRRQLLNINRRCLMRRCDRNAQRHIILILRRWKTIIIVDYAKFQSILKDTVRIFVFRLQHKIRDRDRDWDGKAKKKKKKGLCNVCLELKDGGVGFHLRDGVTAIVEKLLVWLAGERNFNQTISILLPSHRVGSAWC